MSKNVPDERLSNLKVLPVTRPSQLESALEGFMLDRQANACTPATCKYYRWLLTPLLTWLAKQGVTEPSAVTATHIRAWLVELQARQAPNSVHHSYVVSKTFFAWLVNEDLLAASPMARVKSPKLPKEILPAYAPEDVRRLLQACERERDRAIILALLDSGLRASELCRLDVSDLNQKTGELRIRLGKGRKDRTTFLGGKSRKAVWKYLLRERPSASGHEPLFLSLQSGERMTVSGLEQLLRRLGAKAEVADVTPHRFRRTFALWSLRSGMDVFALQKLMGHSDLSVLRRYLDQTRQDLEEAHRAHGAVDSML